MCRWIAYSGVATSPERFLFEERYCLIEQSQNARHSTVTVNGDGFGLGWYDREPVPGVFRDLLPAWSDENLRSLAHQITPHMFMAHVRAATDTATMRSNCHPFTHDQALFMHNGKIGGYPMVRRSLEALIEDRYYRARIGNTDSELIFLLLLQHGGLSDFHHALNTVLGKVEGIMAGTGITDPLRFTAALSDGKNLYVTRYASDSLAPTVYFKCFGDSCIVVSEPLDDRDLDWEMVPQGHTLSVGNGTPELRELLIGAKA